MLSQEEFEEKLRSFSMRLPQFSSDSLFSGRHVSLRAGAGDIFKDYEEYDPTTHEISDIDFILSEQQPDKKLLVRRFFNEEVRPSFIVLDSTPSMFFGDKLDMALLAAWFLAVNLAGEGPVCLIDSHDVNKAESYRKIPKARIHSSLRAWRSLWKEELQKIAQAVFSLRQAALGRKKLSSAFIFSDLRNLLRRGRKKANLVIISDFISKEDFVPVFQELRKMGFALMSLLVSEPEEHTWQNIGPLELTDSEAYSPLLAGRASVKKVAEAVSKLRHLQEERLKKSAVVYQEINSAEEVLLSVRLLLKKAKKFK